MTAPAGAATGRTVHGLDERGFVRDWLVSPAWSRACDDLDTVLDAHGDAWGPGGRWVLTNGPDVAPLKHRLYERHRIDTTQPLPELVEGAAVRWSGADGRWLRAHTGTDGLLDWSQFCFTPEYRHAIAATVLEVDQPELRELEVRCTGPFALFVGSRLVLEGDAFGYMQPEEQRVRLLLPSGRTAVHLATWQVAFREVRHVAALRIEGLPLSVVIPSPGADEHRAADAERVLETVGVGPWANVDGRVRITGPVGARLRVRIEGGEERRVELVDGAVELPTTETAQHAALEVDEATTASMLGSGELAIIVLADDDASPITRAFQVSQRLPAVRRTPQGDGPAWRGELLKHVAAGTPGAARALARCELDREALVAAEDVAVPRAMLDARADCADFEAVGAMHLLHRIPADRWPDGVRAGLEQSIIGCKYWIDQPGLDAMCYFTENHQLVWHTAEMLAGERFADRTFTNAGWLGERHAEHGRALAVEWMRRKLAGGFSEFDSNAYLAIDSLALVSIVELAADDAVRRLAEALLDKVLVTLASNSFQGVHAAPHGRSYATTLRSARLEETTPIMRLLWGVGSLNHAVLPATALATARAYAAPRVVRAIATATPEIWEARQVYRGSYRLHHDLLERPYRSDMRIWRTPDAMLSSVQDYRAGLPGLQEHIWGAALSPEVQVYANHPAGDTISSSARPNAWAGQRVLPRVGQHRDHVLVLHRISEDDWAGGTQLWFPIAHLDAWRAHGDWLAGRVGDGYVAVAAEGGFAVERAGREAHQRWIPRRGGRALVATVGRRAVDGAFDAFVDALGTPVWGAPGTPEPAVVYRTRDGIVLERSWDGPLLVDGAAAVGDHEEHLRSPAWSARFGDRAIRAAWGGQEWAIDVESGRRLVPSSCVDKAQAPRAERADGR